MYSASMVLVSITREVLPATYAHIIYARLNTSVLWAWEMVILINGQFKFDFVTKNQYWISDKALYNQEYNLVVDHLDQIIHKWMN